MNCMDQVYELYESGLCTVWIRFMERMDHVYGTYGSIRFMERMDQVYEPCGSGL